MSPMLKRINANCGNWLAESGLLCWRCWLIVAGIVLAFGVVGGIEMGNI